MAAFSRKSSSATPVRFLNMIYTFKFNEELKARSIIHKFRCKKLKARSVILNNFITITKLFFLLNADNIKLYLYIFSDIK